MSLHSGCAMARNSRLASMGVSDDPRSRRTSSRSNISMSSLSFAPSLANSRHWFANPTSLSHVRRLTVICAAGSSTASISRQRIFCHSLDPCPIPLCAMSDAVTPSLFFTSSDAQLLTSASTTSPVSPPYTAPGVVSIAHRCSAVFPSESTESTHAPASSNLCTALACPNRAAMRRAVTREPFTSAPAFSSASTRPQCPWRDA
mmetsp:Transcript_19502/g.48227  ORF Transcript_19502/g.48227 Transcript_19502/m.48227 type:complete len:203 (+) Transcript_19502:730-1338(+)